jgi:RNase P/RNase MRP subunit p29
MSSEDDRLYDFEGRVVHETEKALLLSDGTRQAWFPRSMVQDNGDGTFTVPERLAVEKGFV